MTPTSGKRKFEEFAILCATDRYPHGQPFTPVPRFFFRLWQAYGSTPAGKFLPDSFWISLLLVLDATLGGSPEGEQGKLAQSQIPTEKKDTARWIAAMAGYRDGWLISVKYSDDKRVGSTFRINPYATREDWEEFVFFMSVAWREGLVSRDRSPEEIRAFFIKHLPEPDRPELWVRLIPLYAQPSDEEREKIREDWIRRGFGLLAWTAHTKERRPLNEDAMADDYVLMNLLLLAWLNGKPEDNAPLLPNDPARLKAWYEKRHGNIEEPLTDERLNRVLARFVKVDAPKEREWKDGALEYQWLTQQWKAAKRAAGLEVPSAKPTTEWLTERSGGITPPDETDEGA
jgi:hypothetical protein